MTLMTNHQKRIARDLQDALDACFSAQLTGGIYDRTFYVWPMDAEPSPQEIIGNDFGERVELAGGMALPNRMWLDGGAGIWPEHGTLAYDKEKP